jgi:hypothetical protein
MIWILAVACTLAAAAPAGADPRWTEPVTVAPSTDMSSLAVAPNGTAAVGWGEIVSTGEGSFNAFLRAAVRPPGGPFGPTQTIASDVPATYGFHSLTVLSDSNANLLAVWVREQTRVEASERPAGGSWSTPVPLSASEPILGLKAAMAPDGSASVVWSTGSASPNYRLRAVTKLAGGGWSEPATLEGPGNFVSPSRIATDATGRMVAVWAVGPSTTAINTAVRPPGTAIWGSTQTLAATGAFADVALDGSGNAIAVWSEGTSGSRKIRAAARAAGAGVWDSAEDVTPVATDRLSARVSFEGNGTPIVTWLQNVGTSRYGVYFARRVSSAWTAGVKLSFATRNASDHGIVPMAGNRTLVWFRENETPFGLVGVFAPTGGTFGDARAITPDNIATSSYAVAADGLGHPIAAFINNSDFTLKVSAYDAIGPVISGLTVPASASAGDHIGVSATVADAWSPPQSIAWTFGDGSAGFGASADHVFATAGNFGVSATATDALGNATTSETKLVAVAGPPLVTGGTIPSGTTTAGATGPTPRIEAGLSYHFKVFRTYTVFKDIVVKAVKPATRLDVSCTPKKRGCPFSKKSLKPAARFVLTKLVKNKKLRPGAVIEIRLTKASAIGRMFRMVIQKKKDPKVTRFCLPVGGAKPLRC